MSTAAALKLSSIISTQSIPTPERRRIVAIAAAVAVAQSLPMPSSPVTNPGSVFQSQQLTVVRERLSYLNEVSVFDVQIAMDFTVKQWMIRYNALHGATFQPIANDRYCFFSNVMGLYQHISVEEYDYCTQYQKAILALTLGFQDAMKTRFESESNAAAPTLIG